MADNPFQHFRSGQLPPLGIRRSLPDDEQYERSLPPMDAPGEPLTARKHAIRSRVMQEVYDRTTEIGLTLCDFRERDVFLTEFKRVFGVERVRYFIHFFCKYLIPPELVVPYSLSEELVLFDTRSGHGTADHPFRIIVPAYRVGVLAHPQDYYRWVARRGAPHGTLAAPTLVRYEVDGRQESMTPAAQRWEAEVFASPGTIVQFELDSRSRHLAEVDRILLSGQSAFTTWVPTTSPLSVLTSLAPPPRSTTIALTLGEHDGSTVHALITFDAVYAQLADHTRAKILQQARAATPQLRGEERANGLR
ncbi:hypothetical protein JCM10449v2_004053 [Rhodotorula kratochvilovae]